MKLRCLGGFREVGRNAVLLETGKQNILMDCGIKVENGETPLLPKKVDSVLLGHAHLDHTGTLPMLYKSGKPTIYATAATFDTAHLLLKDSMKVAKIKGRPELFTLNDITKMMQHENRITYGQKITIKDAKVEVLDAGHVPGCLVPDTLVHLADGDIEEIGKLEGALDLSCANKSSGKIESSSAICWKKKAPENLYRIKTRTSEIIATPEHHLFAFNGSLNRIKVKDLDVGDFIASLRKIRFEGKFQNLLRLEQNENAKIIRLPKYFSPDFCHIVGYFTGDGSVLGYNGIRFYDKNRSMLQFYKEKIEQYFNINCFIRKVKGVRSYYLDVSSKNMASLFVALSLNKKSPNREVIKPILKSPNSCTSNFLRGLYDAEGYVLKDSIGITMSSKKLIMQLKLILLRFGIISHWKTKRNKKGFSPNNNYYMLNIWNPASIRTFKDTIGFSHAIKTRKLKALVKRCGKSRQKSKIDIFPHINSLLREISETHKKRGLKLNLRISRNEFPVSIKHFYEGHAPSRQSLDKIVNVFEKKIRNLKEINFTAINSWGDLARLCNVINMSQNELARGIKVSQSLISRYMHENRKENIQMGIKCIKRIRDNILENVEGKVVLIRKLINSDLFFDKIVAVEKMKDERHGFVYDFQVNPHHNFIANGILSHNSAMFLIQTHGKRIVYTSDFNTLTTRLLNGAKADLKNIDVLIMECTYSSRNHSKRMDVEKALYQAVIETIENNGVALIPAFAVGRSAEILSVLHSFKPKFPIYLDGMARDATEIVLKYPELLRKASDVEKAVDYTIPVYTEDERRGILNEPCAIVSTGGCLDGGPATYYIKRLWDKINCSLLFSGFQIPGSAGRYLLDTGHYVTEDGIDLKIKMKIQSLDFSAHGGRDQLFEFVNKIRPKKVIAIHGDHCERFATEIRSRFGIDAIAPKMGDILEI